jgi:hypothetical protein
MSEEDTTPAVEEPTSGESFINPDGTYKEGWKDALLPEELRAEKFYDSPFNSNVKELLKTAGNQAKMLGKKGVIPLTENSTDFEKQQWRLAHKVPDTYTYEKPTDLQAIEITDEFVEKTQAALNKVNLDQGQFDTVMGIFHNFWKEKEAEFEATEKEEVGKVNQQILTEENTKYETNSQFVDSAVRQFTQGWTEEDRLKLFGTVDSSGGINSVEHIGLKPLLRKFLINVGMGMGEHRMVAGDIGGKSLQDQLDEAMKDPAYLSGYGKSHQEALDKVQRLREQLNKQLGKPVYQV